MSRKILGISLVPIVLVFPVFATENISERQYLTEDTTFNNVVISEITNNKTGGAILSNYALVITNSDISHNSSGAAAALYDNSLNAYKDKTGNYSVTIDHSYITYNTAGDFGAVAIFSPGSSISNTGFAYNTATANYANLGDGAGALMLGSESQTVVYRDTFSNNTSGTIGGAIATRPINYWLDTNYSGKGTNSSEGAKVDIIFSQFYNNEAGTRGGAFFNSFYNSNNKEGYAYVKSSTFDSNSANLGGGVFIEGWTDAVGGNAKLYIEDSTFVNNSATQFGGAIYNESELIVKDSRNYRNGGGAFSRNTAKKGGAIYNEGVAEITGATFVGNIATSSGGAIENKDNTVQLTLKNAVFTNNSADWAGALLARGTTTITGGSFTGNTSNDGGGAIYLATLADKGHTLDINRTTFKNNGTVGTDVDGGGAIGSFSNLIVKNSTFNGNYFGVNNIDTVADGGGAIFMGSVSNNLIEDSIFKNNTSKTWGGAISMRDSNKGDNEEATLDIVRATFTDNSADKGGAVYNTFHGSEYSEDSVYINSAKFNGNKANKGGAIYNATSGTKDIYGGRLIIDNSTFANNIAFVNGGAIYNESMLVLSGKNIFVNNVAGGVANDINNTGEINILNGTTTLNGGISGTGDLIVENTGVLNIGTSSINQSYLTLDGVLNAELKSVDNYASFNITNGWTGEGTLNISLKSAGEYQVFVNQVFDNEHVNVLSSSIYKYDWNDNYDTISVAVKQIDEIVEETGVKEETIKTVFNMSSSSSKDLQELASKILSKLECSDADKVAVEHATKAINPETESVVQSVSTSVQNTVGNLAVSRMNMPAAIGRNGGDKPRTLSDGIWFQGLYNKTTQNDVFDSYTRGFAVGIDSTIQKKWTIGAGYSFAHSDVNGHTRDTDIDSNTVFVYGQYKPGKWYLNGVLNYTMSEYAEIGESLGIGIKSDFDVRSLGTRFATGYDFNVGLTPELVLRYTHIKTEDYDNSLQIHNSMDDTHFLTSEFGLKFARAVNATKHLKMIPELRAGVKYDLISEESSATITMPGIDSYTINGERLSRFGTDFGAGLTMKYYQLDIALNYNIEMRNDYTSQTGMIKARINF